MLRSLISFFIIFISYSNIHAADLSPITIQKDLFQYQQASSRQETADIRSPEDIIHDIKKLENQRACVILNNLPKSYLVFLEPFFNELEQSTCIKNLRENLSQHLVILNSDFAIKADFLDSNNSHYISALDPIWPISSPKNNFFAGLSYVDTEKAEVVYRTDIIDGGYSRLNLQEGEIILSFDDGPHSNRSKQINTILKKHKVLANFFLVGKNARRYPKVVESLALDGNIIGSHSQNHPQLTKLSLKKAKDEIIEGHNNAILAANYDDSSFFRFPYGARNRELLSFLKEMQLASFFWNMDSLDWKLHDPSELYNHVVGEINREKKGVLLFHDIHFQTVSILDQLLEELKAAGYQIRLAYPKKWSLKR